MSVYDVLIIVHLNTVNMPNVKATTIMWGDVLLYILLYIIYTSN